MFVRHAGHGERQEAQLNAVAGFQAQADAEVA